MGFNQNSTFGFGSNGSGGGGIVVSGANNGLSLSGTVAQLGQTIGAIGDPAQLLHPTEIPMNGFVLNFIDRTSTNTMSFQINTAPEMVFDVVASDWTQSPTISFQNNTVFFNLFGDVANDFFSLLTGDMIGLNFNNASQIFLLESGSILFRNPHSFSASSITDQLYLIQAYGGLYLNNSAVSSVGAQTLNIISPTDANGNIVNTTVTDKGDWVINATWNGNTGIPSTGAMRVNFNTNFSPTNHYWEAIHSVDNLNFETAPITLLQIISMNSFQAQFNLPSSGTPASIQATSDNGLYGANVWLYRGMNPSVADNTGGLTVTTDGSQSGTVRPLPLAGLAIRTDFNNGGTVVVTGTMASFVSDLSIGSPGSISTFIDYSAGNGFNESSGGFTVTKRIAFYANDLTTGLTVTNGYAFYSEGASDFSFLAGKIQVGGTVPTSLAYNVSIPTTVTNSTIVDGMVIYNAGAGAGTGAGLRLGYGSTVATTAEIGGYFDSGTNALGIKLFSNSGVLMATFLQGTITFVGNVLPSNTVTYSLGSSTVAWSSVNTLTVLGPTSNPLYVSSQGTNNLIFAVASTATPVAQFFGSTGNLVLQNGGVFADNAAGILQVAGNIVPTVANTDNIGNSTLYFNEIFTRIIDAVIVRPLDSNDLQITTQTGSNNIKFQFNNTSNTIAQFFGTTGNFVIQPGGGAFVDGGEALQVSGDAAVTGNVSGGLVTAFSGGVRNFATQTPVSGSTSGTATFSEPEGGGSYRLIVIYCAALLGTASYTFPIAFTHTPQILTTNGPAAGIVSALSASAVTLTGVTTTGVIVLIGF